MGGIGEHARWVAGVCLDLVLPPQCLICMAPVVDAGGVCAACWNRLRFLDAPLCERLGTPFAYDPGEGAVSAAALARPPAFARARAAVGFDDASRRLVHVLKYQDRHEVVTMMARLMARAGTGLVRDAELVVPVPLHWRRQWLRRYNQSALLARAVAQGSGKPCAATALRRTRPTRSQVGLNDRQRRKNVRNAFAVPEEQRNRVQDRRILLVDDVFTTGATADACAKACLRAGAGAVDVLVFALVLDPARLHI